MAQLPQSASRPPAGTRAAVLGAFFTLAASRRYQAIRIADLIAVAGVGRSTFYEHFSGKDAVLLAALEPVLVLLANAASNRAPRAAVAAMLQHLWSQRAMLRHLLDSPAAAKLRLRLTAMIEDRLLREEAGLASTRLYAIGAAAAQLAMLRSWTAGEVASPVDAFADQLLNFGSPVRPDRPAYP